MKKILIALALLCSATPCWALDCDVSWGTVITGKDGTQYCESIATMNWWSAINWCNSIGGNLITFNDCTLDGVGYLSSGKCLNLEGVGTHYVWTGLAIGSANAQYVLLSSGAFGSLSRDGNKVALCK